MPRRAAPANRAGRADRTRTSIPPRGGTPVTKLSASAGVTAPAAPHGMLGGKRRVSRGASGDQAGQESLAAGRRRQPPVRTATERDEAQPVATLRGEMTHGDGHAFGDVRLAAVGRAERHRRGDVEQQPRREGALRDEDTHVRDGRPGGDVPVDPADIVAGLVRTHLGELEATPEVAGAVLPGTRPRIRRPTLRSSARISTSGVGPGPAGPGCAARRGGSRGDLRTRQLRHRDGTDEPLEDHVRGDLLGQAVKLGRCGAEGRRAPAHARRTAGRSGDPDDGQGACGVHQVDRAARACPVRDVRHDLRMADGCR